MSQTDKPHSQAVTVLPGPGWQEGPLATFTPLQEAPGPHSPPSSEGPACRTNEGNVPCRIPAWFGLGWGNSKGGQREVQTLRRRLGPQVGVKLSLTQSSPVFASTET